MFEIKTSGACFWALEARRVFCVVYIGAGVGGGKPSPPATGLRDVLWYPCITRRTRRAISRIRRPSKRGTTINSMIGADATLQRKMRCARSRSVQKHFLRRDDAMLHRTIRLREYFSSLIQEDPDSSVGLRSFEMQTKPLPEGRKSMMRSRQNRTLKRRGLGQRMNDAEDELKSRLVYQRRRNEGSTKEGSCAQLAHKKGAQRIEHLEQQFAGTVSARRTFISRNNENVCSGVVSRDFGFLEFL